MGVFTAKVFSASINRAGSKFHACEVGVNGLERCVRTRTSATMGRVHCDWKYLTGSNRAALRTGLLGCRCLCRLPGEQETGLSFTLSSTGHSAIAFHSAYGHVHESGSLIQHLPGAGVWENILFLSQGSHNSLLWIKTYRTCLASGAELAKCWLEHGKISRRASGDAHSLAGLHVFCKDPGLKEPSRAVAISSLHCSRSRNFLWLDWRVLSHVPAENTELPLFYLCFCFHCHNSSLEFPPLLLHMASHKGTIESSSGVCTITLQKQSILQGAGWIFHPNYFNISTEFQN